MQIILVILLILLIAIGGHYLLPLLGVAVIASSALWGVTLATVIFFCVGILLFFVFTGVGALIIISVISFILTITALVLFPILLPLLVPLLIVLLVVGVLRRRNQNAEQKPD